MKNDKLIAERILSLQKEGYLVRDIMLLESVTKGRVHSVLKRNKIRPRRGVLNLFQELAVIEDYKDGMLIKEIEDKYNISEQVIWNTLDRHNIDRIRQKTYPVNIDEILLSDYASGLKLEVIQNNRDVSRTKLYSTLHRYDVKPNRCVPLSKVEELKIIERYKNNERPMDIAASYPEYECYHFVLKILKKYNIPITNHLSVPKEDYFEVGERYIAGESTLDIADDYGCSNCVISRILEEIGVDRRDASHAKQFYDINENYFEVVDTPEKAYWLGFIFGDGCITPRTSCLQIGLQARDRGHLVKFLKAIGSNHPIKEYKNNGFGKGKTYVKIAICNKKMALDLQNYNVIQNKTYDLNWPNKLNDNLWSHFIRGKFDSDGCLCITNPKKFYFCITSFTRFLGELKEKIEQKVDVNCLINEFYSVEGSSASNLWVSGNRQIIKILDWIFANHGGAYLDRKYELYKQALEYYKDINGSEQMEEYLIAH